MPPTTEEKKNAAETSTRRSLADRLNFVVATARARAPMSEQGVNKKFQDIRLGIKNAADCDSLWSALKPHYDSLVKAGTKVKEEHQEAMKKFAAAKNKKARNALDLAAMKKAALAFVHVGVLRIGEDAMVAVCASASYILTELATHGLAVLKGEDKKTLQTHHIINDGAKDLSVWYLIKDLECVQEALSDNKIRDLHKQYTDTRKKLRTRINRNRKRAEEDSTKNKKAINKTIRTLTAELDNLVAPPEPKVYDKERKGPQDNFRHHASAAIAAVKGEHLDQKCDVSLPVRILLSHIVYGVIMKYSDQSGELAAFSRVKTIKAEAIVLINRMSAHPHMESCKKINAYVEDRLAAYAVELEKSKASKADTK